MSTKKVKKNIKSKTKKETQPLKNQSTKEKTESEDRNHWDSSIDDSIFKDSFDKFLGDRNDRRKQLNLKENVRASFNRDSSIEYSVNEDLFMEPVEVDVRTFPNHESSFKASEVIKFADEEITDNVSAKDAFDLSLNLPVLKRVTLCSTPYHKPMLGFQKSGIKGSQCYSPDIFASYDGDDDNLCGSKIENKTTTERIKSGNRVSLPETTFENRRFSKDWVFDRVAKRRKKKLFLETTVENLEKSTVASSDEKNDLVTFKMPIEQTAQNVDDISKYSDSHHSRSLVQQTSNPDNCTFSPVIDSQKSISSLQQNSSYNETGLRDESELSGYRRNVPLRLRRLTNNSTHISNQTSSSIKHSLEDLTNSSEGSQRNSVSLTPNDQWNNEPLSFCGSYEQDHSSVSVSCIDISSEISSNLYENIPIKCEPQSRYTNGSSSDITSPGAFEDEITTPNRPTSPTSKMGITELRKSKTSYSSTKSVCDTQDDLSSGINDFQVDNGDINSFSERFSSFEASITCSSAMSSTMQSSQGNISAAQISQHAMSLQCLSNVSNSSHDSNQNRNSRRHLANQSTTTSSESKDTKTISQGDVFTSLEHSDEESFAIDRTGSLDKILNENKSMNKVRSSTEKSEGLTEIQSMSSSSLNAIEQQESTEPNAVLRPPSLELHKAVSFSNPIVDPRERLTDISNRMNFSNVTKRKPKKRIGNLPAILESSDIQFESENLQELNLSKICDESLRADATSLSVTWHSGKWRRQLSQHIRRSVSMRSAFLLEQTDVESINNLKTSLPNESNRHTLRHSVSFNLSRENFTDFNETTERRTARRRRTSVVNPSVEVGRSTEFDFVTTYDARDTILRKCGQSEPLEFADIYSGSALRQCRKIGEGVYGEVFMYKTDAGRAVVLKIIPIEGTLEVNGEPQKKFDEVLSEIVIALQLSSLRNDKEYMTSSFAEVIQVRCVQGRYPNHLIDLWELYRDNYQTENDHPEAFKDDQLYIVFELGNGGQDLEAFQFSNALQAKSAFQQTALALAIAEKKLQFEHRDLHWGNILLSPIDEKFVTFKLNGNTLQIPSEGIKVTIIDYTLSRMLYDGIVLYNDLSNDEELFTAEGDYQFEIYRFMKNNLENDWQRFEPFNNILWLHYIIDKLINGARYKNTKSRKHRSAIEELMVIRDEITNYKSAAESANA
ncbi:Serine/threonine-protein kinase haspin like [Pseudolycoriella hygida]|uniref:non-specific serine/threonine protein kinase n=1 Tax=Pseudolycoriella hygida TaxID=35572 RepID=A0A9Q0NES6_9DIPT|nr:Serine/threonine-protein kinase haspin like [Pseudolycoriella hygida]